MSGKVITVSVGSNVAPTKTYTILTAGYKGQIASDAGFYNAPYTPLGLTLDPNGPPLTWRNLLEFLSTVMNAPSGSSAVTRLKTEQVMQEMQRRFPGPYTIGEEYDPNTDVWSWKLVFADKHLEVIWHLQNSA
jgi:hypothetical protein